MRLLHLRRGTSAGGQEEEGKSAASVSRHSGGRRRAKAGRSMQDGTHMQSLRRTCDDERDEEH